MEKKTGQKYEVMKQVMDTLEEILCSYQGRGHQSVYMDSLGLLANFIMYRTMKVEKYPYEYDNAIYGDEETVKRYRELAVQTRWRVGQGTQIEPIRMNALKQFASMGTPVYDGHIYYADTGCMQICGEILPLQIFQLFSDRPEVKKLYIFPYQFREEKEKPAYFSFAPAEPVREEMEKYLQEKWEKAYQAAESISKYAIPDVTKK